MTSLATMTSLLKHIVPLCTSVSMGRGVGAENICFRILGRRSIVRVIMQHRTESLGN